MTEELDRLCQRLGKLKFGRPVTHVYNPLEYARQPVLKYFERFGQGPKKVVFLGMNPGPWGMAQTGIPFGEVAAARDWLRLESPVDKPALEHPKRPVEGFDCGRSEVSGSRLWGYFRERYQTPERFFQDHFVYNYCPLLFMEESGRNRTPDKLKATERERLFKICDHALVRLVERLQPEWVVGVGQFAEKRAALALGEGARVGRILHPSPASPAANRGWAEQAEKQLKEQGIL